MNYFIKKSIINILIFFLLPVKILFSEENEVIKKIIIGPEQKKRLLIPSIENKNEKIKLIPPKSIKKSNEDVRRRNRSCKESTRRKRKA